MRKAPYRSLPILALLLLLLGLSVGCGSGDKATDPGGVFNRPPEVSEIQWGNPYSLYVDGDELALSVEASDPENDPLTFIWDWATENAGGTFSSDSTRTTLLTIGDTPGQYQVRITVSDGQNVPISRIIGLTVGNALVGGEITEDTTWSAQEWPYVLSRDVNVRNGATLTINGGVEVQMRKRRSGTNEFNIRILVDTGGRLVTNGSGTQPISIDTNHNMNVEQSHNGIVANHNGALDLFYVRISRASVAVTKRGQGQADLEGLNISQCGTGYLGLREGTGGPGSNARIREVTITGSDGDGVSLNDSQADIERLTVRDCGAVGVRLNGSSAVIVRSQLDSNEGGNLRVDRTSTVDMSCSNLIPHAGGYNVVFPAESQALGGLLPMQNCYWGLAAPQSPEQIRDETFHPDGRIDANVWVRDTDLTGYRSSAIDFNNASDDCN